VNKVAFLTTVYPMKDSYLDDFFGSLSEQSYSEFDLIVVNDGYGSLNKWRQKYLQLRIIELSSSTSPAKNREIGINYVIDQKYEILIFGDSDDYFDENRIALSVDLLNHTNIVVNDVSLVEDGRVLQEKYFSTRIADMTRIDANLVSDKNIFGFTNTAISLKYIENVIFPEEVIAVDWYFYTYLLRCDLDAIFTNQTISYYRQHEQSLIGLGKINEKVFNLGVKTKLMHYKFFPDLVNLQYQIEKLSQSDIQLAIASIKSKPRLNSWWWEDIKGQIN